MRVLVCGGRDFKDQGYLNRALSTLDKHHDFTVLIHGDSRGADKMAAGWAKVKGIEILPFPADWNKYGKRAGPFRNQQMLDEGKPDCVVTFPGGNGTADMVRRARKAGVEVIEY